MRAKVLGIQKLDYVNKKNQNVKGTSFHVAHVDAHVKGLKCETVFCSDKYDIPGVESVDIDEEVDFSYNRYGGIDSVEVVNPAK